MQKIVLRYGLIAGLILAAFMATSIPMWRSGKPIPSYSEIVGYAVMVAAFSTIFFGVRSFRDKSLDGQISFGKAFLTGLGISLIASAFDVIAWLIIYETAAKDFADLYSQQYVEQLQKSGKTAAEIETQLVKVEKSMALYENNVFYRIAITLMEVFPVGLLVSLICAGLLKRKHSV